MFERILVALIVSLPSILAALAALLKVVQVRRELAENTAKTAKTERKVERVLKVSAATHALVNDRMSKALQEMARVKHRVAQLTGSPADLEAARRAEEDFYQHEAQQEAVDRMRGTDAEKRGEPGPPENMP